MHHNDRRSPLVLAILDGFGDMPPAEDNAVWLARAPFLHGLLNTVAPAGRTYRSHLRAHGAAVGLPSEGDMGNSEVGHNIIGAGRVFDQGAKQVEEAIKDGSLWGEGWQRVVGRGRVHFIGLLSDGNVHSHIRHLDILLRRAAADGATSLVVHALFDGRDVIDHTAETYLAQLQQTLDAVRGEFGVEAVVGSGGGRMATTMDRYEADWTIVERGYRAHVTGTARPFPSAEEALATLRKEHPGVSDQFLPEFTVVDDDGAPVGAMRDGDAVVLFNFRGDRMIEIYRALTEEPFDAFPRGALPADLLVAGLTMYDGDLGIPALFLVSPVKVAGTVSEVIARAGLRQAAIAETQKFGHVTYFWNGNRSDKFDLDLEEYIEIPSDRVPFEQRPWMKSAETADELIRCIESGSFEFIRANFAAGDMVGHTGDIDASVVAVEAMDISLERVFDAVRACGGTLVVTADHGNCEVLRERDKAGDTLLDADGVPVPKKSHTLSPVPFVVVDFVPRTLAISSTEGLGLANIAGSLLEMLGLPVPGDYAEPVVTVTAD
ncbi:MAG: 2,3-bisphosphoglycerate-independent phosphoglycerate mutase [Ilumatobacteraceae bacterium]